MKKFLKYTVVPAGIFSFLLIVTLILIPVLINIPKYVPEIEKQVRQATGRSFSIGQDLGVSLFPWLSITFSDMHLGNPPGFEGDTFIKIRTCEARIKILPLLRKHIEISRFVVGGLSLNLERNAAGKGNWDLGREVESGKDSKSTAAWALDFMATRLSAALVAVTDGQVQYNDRTRNIRHQVEDFILMLNDYSPNSQGSIDCSGTFDDKTVSLAGKIGPFFVNSTQTVFPLDLAFNVVQALEGKIGGKITVQENGVNYDLSLNLSPFSPHELFSAFDLPSPLQWKDFATFKVNQVDLVARGTSEGIAIEKGTALFDDSKLNFSLKAKDFRHPQIDFDLGLDRIEVDRYLPTPVGESTTTAVSGEAGDAADNVYRYLKDVTFDGVMRIGELQLHGGTMRDLLLPLKGKERVFTADPATLKIGDGQLDAVLTLDLRGTEPSMQANLKAMGLDAQELFRDYFGWDGLRGHLSADVALWFGGKNLRSMKKSLNGEASLQLTNGAVVGLDLAKVAGTAESKNSAAPSETPGEKPRTEFAAGKVLATINNGFMQIRGTGQITGQSSLQVNGSADIVQGLLNLKLETGGAATVAGKGGSQTPKGHTPFYVIRGTFSELEIVSDKDLPTGLKADSKINVRKLVAQSVDVPAEDELKNLVGKDLVDPAVVAERFGLSIQTLQRTAVKKKIPLGTGKIHIGVLREEPALH